MNRLAAMAGVVALGAVLSACGGAATGPISADVKEFSITLGRSTAAAGTVQFNVKNSGAVVHEFVVIDTDTAAGALPITGDTVSEDGLTVVDEIEDIAVAATPTLSVTLTPGHYAIICNIEGHYAAGMHADLTVQ
ncbi:MAG: sulfocyanin-like copper-binding protein [Chloroflexota bacterium]